MRFRGVALTVLVAGLALAGCSKESGNQAKAEGQAIDAGGKSAAQMTDADKAAQAAGMLVSAQAPVAPAWTLPTPDGKKISLADYKGKVIILDFWDTWCPPCKREIPGFIELQKQYEDQGLVVIGAAFGRDGAGAVKQFVQQHDMNYPVVMADGQTNRNYGGINSIPTTFVIDRTGRARAKHVGYVEKSVFERQVKTLLAQK